ncbi:hypothetical protein G8770_19150 [Aestuariicella hydrocarbonica]|uniref:Uncharacterized protein n=1 Tax=Pseudomaricurvus hydrocarbonicus TaxID=1470433 RepID=A0A9E5T485_9GAMM|nr:hypothetical protein [Aestuariicella hydrocarbonica]NHO67669.1 hypothetical protein [Aestuariicella hydrocarbonica]
MLHPDFNNGKKLDLQLAMALFVMMMGFLFYIDAEPGTHTLISLLTILAGVAWFVGHSALKRWHHKH